MTTDLELALEAATAAGKLTLHYFRHRALKVFTKRDLSPVTEADRHAEKKIISIIRSKFPKDGFLGEEFGEKPSKNGRRWIIDPIDGTKSFIHGVPLYGVMLGLEVDGEMQLGVIDLPALAETVYAERGYGAYRNVHRLSVSDVDSLSEATLLTSSESYLIESRSKHVLDTLKREVKLVRMWGDCWGHTLVAAGQADIMVEPKMSPWDAAALMPIIEEAGGKCFDYSGTRTIYGKGFITANARLGDMLLQRLKRSQK
ncbi:MAG: histidinol-phosphatase [Candidatus Thermochlorobacter sp.]